MINPFLSQRKLVQKIHDEFDSAMDRLLVEAKSIIESVPQTEKWKRLQQLGFTSSEPVKQAEQINYHLAINRQQADLILYHKETYPFQKFLTEIELDRICDKYNLVYAPVSAYLKDVPEKNLKDIELAPPIKTEDKVGTITKITYTGELEADTLEHQKNLYRKGIFVAGSSPAYPSYIFRDATGLRKHSHSAVYWEAKEMNRSGLFIAAPKSHFNLKGLTKTASRRFEFVTIKKDPIVFRYVRGGVQVITKWGLEASDEALVNEINN